MLIPLLHLLGFDFGSNTSSEFASAITHFFTDLGITLTLSWVLVSYIIVVSLVAALNYFQSVLTVQVRQDYICYIRHRLYRALLYCRWQFIADHKMSDISHSLTVQVQDVGYASYQMLSLLSQLVLVVVYVLISLVLSWQMSLLAMICGVVLLLSLLPLHKSVIHSGEEQLDSYKDIFQMASEQLASLKMIKSYGSEERYARELEAVSRSLEEQEVTLTRISSLTQFVYMVGAVVSFSTFFYFAVEWLSVSLATLLLLLLIFSRLLPQISNIQSSYQNILYSLPSLEQVRQMTMACEAAGEPVIASDIQAPILEHELILEDICFSYKGSDRKIVDHLSLTIQKNSTIALMGESGAGKSTLADLIAGLLIPDSGNIYCDSTLLEGEQRLAWRRGIAYITQEVFLFHDSVRANLNWIRPEAGESELWEALELAEAARFVKRLPDGLDTVIGDRGVRLSGGERQRLALARAFLSKPQLLILDEATSALDRKNEKKIQQALKHMDGKLTIIIIAHRETTIQHVRQRVVLGPARGTDTGE